jgi:hypothetical protein
MIVIILIFAFLLFLVFALNGAGSSYGKSRDYNSKSKLNLNDKNFFL